jgi:hypothetical protein
MKTASADTARLEGRPHARYGAAPATGTVPVRDPGATD